MSQTCENRVPTSNDQKPVPQSDTVSLPAESPSFLSPNLLTAFLAIIGIAAYLSLRYALAMQDFVSDIPLLVVLIAGGGNLLLGLARRVMRGEFGSDLLAGISIVAAVVLHQYLAGSLVVLMLSGGAALELYALRQASSVLRALAKRMPHTAHVREQGTLRDVPVESIHVHDNIVVLPHEVCPADSIVIEGHGSMDESFLTGEPYEVDKAPGCTVLSGALNGESPLALSVVRVPADSRYASITRVMRDAEQQRPQMRRLGDRLGAWYTPAALGVAVLAWMLSGDAHRFLAVLVVATPCPLLIAIPVAIIGTISLAARRGIIVRDPAVLERLDTCRTIFFDKTGTLTYGRPRLELLHLSTEFTQEDALGLAGSLEQYSRHPLAKAVVRAARDLNIPLAQAQDVSESPGHGLTGNVDGRHVRITGRSKVGPCVAAHMPPLGSGLECVLVVDGVYAATLQFLDEPRTDVRSFVGHLGPHHQVQQTVLLTGDRQEEAHRMARHAGIDVVLAGHSPEQKLSVVREATLKSPTLFLGDGINDAPAMLGATVGIAFGSANDVTSEAAGAVILEPSLRKLDELLHIARRLRRIAFQSAVGGMAASLVAVGFAAVGMLAPVPGALLQEVIDLAAVLNALRAAFTPRALSDFA